jgi:hypothetical protein
MTIVTRWVWGKIAQNFAQSKICSKLIHNFCCVKSSQ